MTDNMIKFRPEWFGAYGLDKNKIFFKHLCANVVVEKR